MTSSLYRLFATLVHPFTGCPLPVISQRVPAQHPNAIAISPDLTLSSPLEFSTQLDGVGYSEIWVARYKGTMVCAKVLRFPFGALGNKVPGQLERRAIRELSVWSKLDHQNILPLLGYSLSEEDGLVLVSPLQNAGCASDYLRAHSDVDRLHLVGGIGEGLSYLHSRDIIHGDLKGSNVVISCQGSQIIPLICDFGVSRVLGARGYTTAIRGTLPWMAPELVESTVASRALSAGSDVWAWGMTVYELFTDTVPFHDVHGTEYVLANHITEGGLPSYPGLQAFERGMTPEFWVFLATCWDKEPSERPPSDSIVHRIREFHDHWVHLCAIRASNNQTHNSTSIRSCKMPLQPTSQQPLESTNLIQTTTSNQPVYPPADIPDVVTRQYPQFNLSGSVELRESLASGSNGDLYLARWKGRTCCAKVLRYVGSVSNEGAQSALDQRAKREMAIWFGLSHPNILALYGYCLNLGPSLTFICPYVPEGNASAFLSKNESVDRLALVAGIGEGLKYIHGRNIVHGDLKGVNVLVSGSTSDPIPLLCDFGLSRASDVAGFTTNAGSTTNWMAKELLGDSDEDCVFTPASDIWAWGMTVYELLTGEVPFHDLPYNCFTLARHISNGGLPKQPGSPATERGLTQGMWELLGKCWSSSPEKRPSASDVISETWQLHAKWRAENNTS